MNAIFVFIESKNCGKDPESKVCLSKISITNFGQKSATENPHLYCEIPVLQVVPCITETQASLDSASRCFCSAFVPTHYQGNRRAIRASIFGIDVLQPPKGK